MFVNRLQRDNRSQQDDEERSDLALHLKSRLEKITTALVSNNAM